MLNMTNVRKNYGDFSLECSLQTAPGFVTGLIGQNGAGKSTTFKSILDLTHIDEGSILLFGKPHTSLSASEKEDIGVVLADSCFSGYLNVSAVIPVMAAMYKKFDQKKFIGQCEAFNIPLTKSLKEFSTGMRAKLKILLALSHEAKLLILDEPTAGLDVIARDSILSMLRAYMEGGGRSILISSHISTDLEGLCDDIYFIDNGRIILHEDTDVLLNSYAALKVDKAQYEKLDKAHIICAKRESYGYHLLTNERQFYLENYPGIVIEKSSIDDIIMLRLKGELL